MALEEEIDFRHVGKHVGLGGTQLLGDLGEARLVQVQGIADRLTGRLRGRLAEDRLRHREHCRRVLLGHRRRDVAQVVVLMPMSA